jgi:hypothetical protein
METKNSIQDPQSNHVDVINNFLNENNFEFSYIDNAFMLETDKHMIKIDVNDSIISVKFIKLRNRFSFNNINPIFKFKFPFLYKRILWNPEQENFDEFYVKNLSTILPIKSL